MCDRCGEVLTGPYLAFRFVLLRPGIAVGYHLAHYFTLAFTLSPSPWAVLASPLSPPPNPQVLVLPGWIGLVDVAFVLPATCSPSGPPTRSRSTRSRVVCRPSGSQFPFVVMVLYTMLGLWRLSLPTVEPPYAA